MRQGDSIIPSLTSKSGLTLPGVGFGTYQLNGAGGVVAIAEALGHGYRLLDSAFRYENEGAVGRAVRDSPVDRAEVIVTSKLPGSRHRFEQALDTVTESLYRTGLEYLDLYLIHWPNPREGLFVEAWRALIEARDRGIVRAVGVCNFLPEHLTLLEEETGELPAVNQIEMHPYFPQAQALAFHREKGMLTEAWSPLGRGTDLLDNPVIAEIARVHGVSPAKVVLGWHVARGSIPLPKSSTPVRQRENVEIFGVGLTNAEVDRITALGRPDGRVAGQDPAVYEEF